MRLATLDVCVFTLYMLRRRVNITSHRIKNISTFFQHFNELRANEYTHVTSLSTLFPGQLDHAFLILIRIYTKLHVVACTPIFFITCIKIWKDNGGGTRAYWEFLGSILFWLAENPVNLRMSRSRCSHVFVRWYIEVLSETNHGNNK